MISKFKKKFQFVELVETNPLKYNTLNFDQYLHFAILEYFLVSAIN